MASLQRLARGLESIGATPQPEHTMQNLIVPLAAMIPASQAPIAWAELGARKPERALELSDSDEEILVLTEEVASDLERDAGDAAVMAVCADETLARDVDFRRLRALIEREVQVASAGPLFLTPVYLYLAGVGCSRARVNRCMSDLAARLSRLGLKPQLPEGVRRLDARATRKVRTAPRRRRAVGTRVSAFFA
jgi:hypothetical protein